MVIHPLQITFEKSFVRVSAKIEWENKNIDFPDTLFYKFPKKYSESLSRNMNGFLVSLVPIAMKYGENIHVSGSISSKIEYNLKEYQQILHFWCPDEFSVINITYDALVRKPTTEITKGALCSFSGGIDSTYTLWSHLPQNESDPTRQITHTMFIKGFDTLEDSVTHNSKLESFQELMNKLNITFIPVETNVRKFCKNINIAVTHSSIVVGAALFLEQLVPRFYFSEDVTHDFHTHFTLHPILVPKLSTENMNISSFGGSVSKLMKLETISRWTETHQRLVVCHENPYKLQNCGTCNKCIMTMTLLDLGNSTYIYSTFPKKLRKQDLMNMQFPAEQLCFPKAWIGYAQSKKRWDIVLEYNIIILKNRYRLTRKQSNVVSYIHTATVFPITFLYDLSAVLKYYVPAYKQFVYWVKNTPREHKL